MLEQIQSIPALIDVLPLWFWLPLWLFRLLAGLAFAYVSIDVHGFIRAHDDMQVRNLNLVTAYARVIWWRALGYLAFLPAMSNGSYWMLLWLTVEACIVEHALLLTYRTVFDDWRRRLLYPASDAQLRTMLAAWPETARPVTPMRARKGTDANHVP